MQRRYFVYSFSALIAGVLMGTFLSKLLIIPAVLAVLVVPLLLIKNFKKRLPLVFTVVFVALGILSASFQLPHPGEKYKSLSFEGTITSVEQLTEAKKVIVKNCGINGNTSNVSMVVDDELSVQEGMRVSVTGMAYPLIPDSVTRGNVTDYLSAMADDVDYIVYPESVSAINEAPGFNGIFPLLRQKVRDLIFYNVHNSESAAVLYAMLAGDKGYISATLQETFARCGTSHLLAVSGLHVSILLSTVLALFKKLKAKPIITFIIAATFLLFYCGFTGFSPSMVRAAIMALFMLSAHGKRYDSLNSLCLAGTLLLLFTPFSLFDLSFQFSFSACLGVIVFLKFRPMLRNKVIRRITDSLCMTLGATVFTLPFTVYYFGTVSVISVIANILLVPMATVALLLLFIFVVLGSIWSGFGFLIKIPGFVMQGILFVTKLLGRAPYVSFGTISIIVAVMAFVLMIFFSSFIHVSPIIKRKIFGVLLIVLTLVNTFSSIYNANYVVLNVPNIEGNYIVAHLKDKKHYIFGLHTEDYALSQQLKYISRSAYKPEALFLFTPEQLNVLPKAVEMGLTFNTLYVAPYVPLTKEARLLGAVVPDGSIAVESGDITFAGGGVVYRCGETSVYIQGQPYTLATDNYTVAVTLSQAVNADTIITKNTLAKNAKKYYDISQTGHVSLPIRRN